MLTRLMDHVTEDETSLSVILCGKHPIRARASENPRAVIEHLMSSIFLFSDVSKRTELFLGGKEI